MTTKNSSVLCAALLSTLVLASVAGCDPSPAEEQQKIEAAQREEAKRTAEAQNAAETKITSAQMEADKKIEKAKAEFDKARTDYRSELDKDVADLDKKVDKIEASAKTATGKKKAEVDAALPNVREKQQALHADLAMIDSATVQNWDAVKNKVDTDRKSLSNAIDKAPFSAR